MSSRDYSEIFKKNYLTSVACEIRFTSLLLIKERIGEFQKKLEMNFQNLKRVFLFQDNLNLKSGFLNLRMIRIN